MDDATFKDLLIRMDQKLDDMMPRVSKIEAAMDKQRDVCLSRIHSCNRVMDQKVPSVMFRWIVGILITGLIAVGASSTNTNLKVNDLSHDVKGLQEDIKLWHPDNRPIVIHKKVKQKSTQ